MAKRKKKSGWWLALICIAIIAFGAWFVYQRFFLAKVRLKDKNYAFVFIKSTDSIDDLLNTFKDEGLVENTESFKWLAQKMGLENNIHPGKYRIINGMNMRQIINLIKYGKEEKIKLTFNSQIHTIEEWVTYTDEKLEMSESDLEAMTEDEKKLYDNFKLDPANSFAMIVPGTFEVSWAISPDKFVNTLKDRFYKVWNANRLALAKKVNFSFSDVIILASIVQSESSIRSEQEKIAGVYINRLRKDMLLQADPTLKFANGNYNDQRVLDVDKQIDSPYNTYMYKGLPPGPICLVSTQAIDATLNYTRHNYIFFCAKPQLNGYSEFSTNYAQHQKYASAYQNAINKRGIKR